MIAIATSESLPQGPSDPPVVGFGVSATVELCRPVVDEPASVMVVSPGGSSQVGNVKTFESKVIEPFRASARPPMLEPVFTEMDVSAMVVPTNVVSVPRVAELPACQNTLPSCVPFDEGDRVR